MLTADLVGFAARGFVRAEPSLQPRPPLCQAGSSSFLSPGPAFDALLFPLSLVELNRGLLASVDTDARAAATHGHSAALTSEPDLSVVTHVSSFVTLGSRCCDWRGNSTD